MGARFKVDEMVWVPSTQVRGDDAYALVKRKVRGLENRSLLVDGPEGEPVKVATRRVHSANLGFLVLRIGDCQTESTLLDPLAKSVLQYLRLLIPDGEVRAMHVRTHEEIAHVLKLEGARYSHVIVIGHGASDQILTLNGGITGGEFADLLHHGDPKVVISLACGTGQQPFAQPLSRGAACRDYVAPFREAHGAAASLFLQTLLHLHLLRGREFQAAFRVANTVLDGTHFQHWRDGKRR